ncbi:MULTISPECIES: hypothetical protein [unclassified Microcoleus]|uniref:hypothetical protein n=1 Tax=unclassified Microcoleus TaxID=2642155 RepID=UPI002FCEF3CD
MFARLRISWDSPDRKLNYVPRCHNKLPPLRSESGIKCQSSEADNETSLSQSGTAIRDEGSLAIESGLWQLRQRHRLSAKFFLQVFYLYRYANGRLPGNFPIAVFISVS